MDQTEFLFLGIWAFLFQNSNKFYIYNIHNEINESRVRRKRWNQILLYEKVLNYLSAEDLYHG